MGNFSLERGVHLASPFFSMTCLKFPARSEISCKLGPQVREENGTLVKGQVMTKVSCHKIFEKKWTYFLALSFK